MPLKLGDKFLYSNHTNTTLTNRRYLVFGVLGTKNKIKLIIIIVVIMVNEYYDNKKI